MKKSDILIEAKNLIGYQSRFVSHSAAIDNQGITCRSTDQRAVAWCSVGALNKVLRERGLYWDYMLYNDLFNYLNKFMEPCIGKFNINNSHKIIMDAWNKAIDLAKKEEFNHEKYN